ncbi:MAG: ATP-dependent Clp protease ATP-binding subunit [Myxococcales bacterium]|nr:ATP-dependent Clp protease ATP-binding subunit [Myxococcales bacterium]
MNAARPLHEGERAGGRARMDVVGVKGIVAQAKRAAQRRGQRPSTAHLLLVMLQTGGDASELLGGHGIRESELLSALKVVDPEAQSTLDRVLERSAQLAQSYGHAEPGALHLLLAIARDTRTAGHRSLQQVGAQMQVVQDQLLARLHVGPEPVVARADDSLSEASRLPMALPRGVTAARRVPTPPRPDRRGSASSSGALSGADVEVARTSSSGAQRAPGDTGAQRAPGDTGASRAAGDVRAAEHARNRDRRARRHARAASAVGERRGVASRRLTSLRPAARRDPSKPLAPLPPTALELAMELPLGPFDLDPDRFPLLSGLGRNLTALAHDGHFDPVVGRERELDLLLDVLARRRSNNPILVGAPGVGKTAIVEGLAQRLAEGGPAVSGLEGRIVVEISAGSLVSGTGVRGALADKIRKLRDEVALGGGRVVLFIDEIHAIVSGEGGDELAQELKSALARGELPCIGATTEAEYRRHFEKDAALARRFSAIHVDEPSVEACAEILRGLLPRYEQHHAIRYAADAAAAAIELSVRFLPEQRLPDKAVGVLDLAAARTRRRGGRSVDRAAVASVIAEQARVPVERLLLRDGERLLKLEGLLRERVVGQDAPLARVADALRKGAAGFRGRRPLGTFLFLGPTGVGKTETAKAISDIFFGAPMTRLDMSELGESHAVSRMLGSPPGYVGHDDGGQLTEAVRRRPYQLILLDEVEKAHPEVLLSLLPLLDEGRLTDGKGRTVDFTNTIIVMTSNLGVQAAARRGIGFGASEGASSGDAVLEVARRALPPELWNRIDEPIFFGALDRGAVREIAERLLVSLRTAVSRERGVEISYDEATLDALLDAGGYDAAYGARPLRRVVGRLVEAPLARMLLSGEVSRGGRVAVVGEGARVEIVARRGS